MGEGPEQVLIPTYPGACSPDALAAMRKPVPLLAQSAACVATSRRCCAQGKVKVGDFGLARFVREPLRPMSENGVVVGSACTASRALPLEFAACGVSVTSSTCQVLGCR